MQKCCCFQLNTYTDENFPSCGGYFFTFNLNTNEVNISLTQAFLFIQYLKCYSTNCYFFMSLFKNNFCFIFGCNQNVALQRQIWSLFWMPLQVWVKIILKRCYSSLKTSWAMLTSTLGMCKLAFLHTVLLSR